MFRFLFLVLPLLVSPAPVRAEVTSQALWDILRAGDVAEMERTMDSLHLEARTNPDALKNERDLYSRFVAGNPRVDDFTQRWMQDFPDSAYALTARSTFLTQRAWTMRGGNQAMWTWPEAMARFQTDIADAEPLAVEAYRIMPDLVPASDAILKLQMVTQRLSTEDLGALVEEVLTVSPNMGTVSYAIESLNPGWGGAGGPVARAFCDRFGGMTGDPDYSPEVCWIFAAIGGTFAREAAFEASQMLEMNRSPLLDTLRLPRLGQPATPELRKQLRTYLLEKGDHDLNRMALYRTQYYLDPVNHPDPEIDAFIETQFARVVQALKEQPNHAPSITYLLDASRDEEGRPVSYGSASLQAMAQRLLITAPYDPSAWYRLVEFSEALNTTQNRRDVNRLSANAIAYSNHHPYYLGHLAEKRLRDYRDLLQGRGPHSGMTRAEQAEFFLCPIIRMRRLFDAVCLSVSNEWSCQDGFFNQPIDDLYSMAETQGLCEKERLAPVALIAFEPESAL